MLYFPLMGTLESAAQGGPDQLLGEQTHSPVASQTEKVVEALHNCALRRQDGRECPQQHCCALS